VQGRKHRRGAGGGAVPIDLTFVTHVVGNSTSKSIPAGASIGDLCVIFDHGFGSSLPADVTPTDFTQLVTASGALSDGNDMRSKISAKVLVSGDPGSTVTGINGGTNDRYITMIFSPSAPISGFEINSPNEQFTTGNPTSQTIAASGETNLGILMLGDMYAGTAISPRTASGMEEQLGGATTQYSHYRIFNDGDTPVNQTYDMDDEGDGQSLLSCYLTLIPA